MELRQHFYSFWDPYEDKTEMFQALSLRNKMYQKEYFLRLQQGKSDTK